MRDPESNTVTIQPGPSEMFRNRHGPLNTKASGTISGKNVPREPEMCLNLSIPGTIIC